MNDYVHWTDLGYRLTLGAIGTFNYAMSEQSVAIRQAANAAMRGIANHRGSGVLWH